MIFKNIYKSRMCRRWKSYIPAERMSEHLSHISEWTALKLLVYEFNPFTKHSEDDVKFVKDTSSRLLKNSALGFRTIGLSTVLWAATPPRYFSFPIVHDHKARISHR